MVSEEGGLCEVTTLSHQACHFVEIAKNPICTSVFLLSSLCTRAEAFQHREFSTSSVCESKPLNTTFFVVLLD